MVFWTEEFSSYLSQANPQTYISHETVPLVMIPTIFFAFQFENPWQLKFCCLKWPPGLYQFSDFISCSHADSSECAGKTFSPQLGSAHSLVEHLLVLLTFSGLWGELNSCRKSKYVTIYYKKKVSSSFILPENSVSSIVCSPAVIMLSPRLRRKMQINFKKGGRDVILSATGFKNN